MSQALSEDERWMHHALLLARKAYELGEVPVGAVIVRDGQVIGEGWNCPIGNHDPTAHAEVMALRDAGTKENNYRLPGSVLYVTIEPCTMCVGALIHGRVDRVVFGATEPKAGAVVSQNCLFDHDSVNTRVVYLGGVCETECRLIISDFFAQRRAQKKRDKKVIESIDKQ
ncbi:tRNA adenosine(34) deaminase TadA [Alkalimarinus alittae]|uniref:tRNA-specific adenosine deaminase n=1 Tax=Alkalimarinus alittae TaxID=2961619 RepID=A0ABY6N681_9ALTE|nr:tRNA adenosine(34) deaminase TadA [Alkalimarinus alittae]UZE97589.1 tRNA adenosine(34) deaminase TadA [Alkalimarinus alittae]